MLSRRGFLVGSIATVGLAEMPAFAARAASPFSLTAATGVVDLTGSQGPETAVWFYNDRIPGPELRFKTGDMLDIAFTNQLPDPTTAHWHGLRPPVGMDGVPYTSQPPVATGEGFTYRFPLTESGTYWYHPHFEGSQQVGRGLRGVLIIEDEEPLDVDREVTWLLDDWRMDNSAQLAPFGGMHDASHAGRIGNVVTVNGSLQTGEPVRAGERIRLRLINGANARLFALEFPMDRIWVVALDGHPVEPTHPEESRVWIAPGQRVDVIVDMTGDPGTEMKILDAAYGDRQRYHLMSFEYGAQAPLRDLTARAAPEGLRPHSLPEPDMEKAARHEIVFEGGAMGGLHGAMMGDKFLSIQELVAAGRLWAINGTVPEHMHGADPLFTFSQGSSHVLAMANLTAFPHPIHLHGHVFRVISQNGKPVPHRPWRDTVLLWPDQTIEIVFVADNPGDWMFHCHILEHQDAGMMATVSVI
jgi:FtsP/CotA-like multicopper oxidase with cupredoxin domain